jgi:hypothetical protein
MLREQTLGVERTDTRGLLLQYTVTGVRLIAAALVGSTAINYVECRLFFVGSRPAASCDRNISCYILYQTKHP